mgnify:CR=1 FL=1
MTQQEKVKQLASLVGERILPLIDHDYVLYGLPYYTNIGDTLIWEGTLELLKKVPFKCKGVCGWNAYPTSKIAGDNIILIQGGGYFGDVWRNGWQYVLDGIRQFKNNRIIVLPQSIHYNDESLRKKDAQYLSEFKHLIICARDQKSYDYAKSHFSNEVVLVPDMAFCIKKTYLDRWVLPSSSRVLLLKRCDKELVTDDIVIPDTNVEEHDWPTMETTTDAESRFAYVIAKLRKAQRKLPKMSSVFRKIEDDMYYRFYRKMMTSRGVSFLSSYQRIYTTRLHVLILSVILEKEVYIIDNSYGKLSACYDTWLKEVEKVGLYKKMD